MALLLIDRDVVRLNNPPADRFPVQGIDVSHHQGVVDWERVASNRAIRFVYIKASEGGDFRDASFTENWNGARRGGLVAGAYHYFTFCRSGRDQAANFLAATP